MPEGKYFVIRSRLEGGLVLEGSGEGEPVVTRPYTGGDTQCWFECTVTGSIRNKQSDLCLQISEGTITVGAFVEEDKSQEWTIATDRIQDKNNQKLVVQVNDSCTDPGSKLIVGEFNNSASQLWNFEFQEADYFYIVSKLHGKVICVKDAKVEPGADVVMWDKKADKEDSQLWYDDKYGIIKSKMNNFVLQCKKAEIGEAMIMEPFSPGESKQLWARLGDCIVSSVHPKQVVSIKKKKTDNGTKLVVGKFKDEANTGQHWIYETVSS